jgi:heat shock protein HtpX
MMLGGMLRTTLLLGALTGLLLALGYLVAGPEGVLPALLLAALLNFGAYWFSDRAALAMAGAREVSYAEAPALHRIVAELAARAGLPMPRVAIIDAAAPNAFATGRDPGHAVVAVTTGLLEVLDEDELVAVLAHELGHVRNRDILISSVAATLAGAVTAPADWLQWGLFFGAHHDDEERSPLRWLGAIPMLILAPIAAVLIQLAISRGREFGADETGAELVGDPLALARALEKIEADAAGTPLRVNPAAGHLVIIPPLTGEALASLLSTHPSTAARVRRLEQLAARLFPRWPRSTPGAAAAPLSGRA